MGIIANSSQPYTLPSRSNDQHTNPNLSKSMAAPTHGQTVENGLVPKMTGLF